MKRHLVFGISFIICLLVGCSSLSRNTSSTSEKNTIETNAKPITQDYFISNDTQTKQEVEKEPTSIYEMWVLAKSYQQKEEAGTLSDKEAEKWNALKDQVNAHKKKSTGTGSANRGNIPTLTMPELVTMLWGHEHGYTMKEIDWELDLGFFQDNPYCETDIRALRVMSVVSPESALVYACPYTKDTEGCNPVDVKIYLYISLDEEELLYDNKKVVVPDDLCVTMTGTTSYYTRAGEATTVPMITFADRRVNNTQLERLKQTKQNMPHVDFRTGEIHRRSK